MNDANLLAFGCGVSFIAAAGFYVYLRACWSAEEEAKRVEVRPEPSSPTRLRDVA